MGLDARKPVFGVCEQQRRRPACAALPRSLIIAFVIHLLESIISKPATSEISLFRLVSVAVETGFSIALSETPKTGLCCIEAHITVQSLYNTPRNNMDLDITVM